MCEKIILNIACYYLILILSAFDLLVASGTHKGTGSSFQMDHSALDSCAWGTSPLFRALLPCQTLLGGTALYQTEIFPEQREKASPSIAYW